MQDWEFNVFMLSWNVSSCCLSPRFPPQRILPSAAHIIIKDSNTIMPGPSWRLQWVILLPWMRWYPLGGFSIERSILHPSKMVIVLVRGDVTSRPGPGHFCCEILRILNVSYFTSETWRRHESQLVLVVWGSDQVRIRASPAKQGSGFQTWLIYQQWNLPHTHTLVLSASSCEAL